MFFSPRHEKYTNIYFMYYVLTVPRLGVNNFFLINTSPSRPYIIILIEVSKYVTIRIGNISHLREENHHSRVTKIKPENPPN